MSCLSNYQEYNFPRIRTNESFKGASFRVVVNGVPLDLTGWTSKIQFREGSPTGDVGLTRTNLDGITHSGDTITVAPVAAHGLTTGDWYYDLVLTDPTTLRHVYFGGVQPVIQGVTTP